MAIAEMVDDPGRLANNFMFVNGLMSALSKTETNVSAVVKSLCFVIDQDCWRGWIDPNGRKVRYNAADFRQFIEAPRPIGCQTPINTMERFLRGTDAWEPFQGAIRGERGGANNPDPKQDVITGRFAPTVNRDEITVDGAPATIPLSPDVPRPRVRDYSREAPTGTSVSYLARRLERQAPELYERVKAGEMTPHAASVEAGFVERKITVPSDPARAARILARHLDRAAVETLVTELCRAAGIPIERI